MQAEQAGDQGDAEWCAKGESGNQAGEDDPCSAAQNLPVAAHTGKYGIGYDCSHQQADGSGQPAALNLGTGLQPVATQPGQRPQQHRQGKRKTDGDVKLRVMA